MPFSERKSATENQAALAGGAGAMNSLWLKQVPLAGWGFLTTKKGRIR